MMLKKKIHSYINIRDTYTTIYTHDSSYRGDLTQISVVEQCLALKVRGNQINGFLINSELQNK